jgi:hypothetical protein
MAQDFYDILQPFDYIVQKLRNEQHTLGIAYVAENDEELLPEYPAVLVQADRTDREIHTTGQFRVVHHLDLWVFHAELTLPTDVRARKDIELATAVRKFLHSDRSLGGHIIHGFVDGEFPIVSPRVIDAQIIGVISTRMTWAGQVRVPFEAS